MPYVRVKYIKGCGPYYYLVRSERDGDKVRQIHIRYLGKDARPGPYHGRDVVPKERVVTEKTEPFHRSDDPTVTYDYNVGGDVSRWNEVKFDVNDLVLIFQDTVKEGKNLRRLYKLRKEITEKKSFKRPHINIVINHKPIREYWGRGVAGPGTGKVWWYTPEKSRRYIEREGSALQVFPPSALGHELEHAIGSHREFDTPIASTVGIRFAMRKPEYVGDTKAEAEKRIGDWMWEYLIRYKKPMEREMLMMFHKENPRMFERIVKKQMHPKDADALMETVR